MLKLKEHIYYQLLVGLLLSLIVSIQSYTLPPKSFDGGIEYPRYNNYIIFKNSFHHLMEDENLYQLYENEHWDLYKYTPTFSLAMAPFYLLPDFLGLLFWNSLNILLLIFAFSKINFKSIKFYWLAFLFLVPEMVTSAQNSQSNILLVALMILSYLSLEKNKLIQAIIYLLLAVFIKPFALAGFIIFLFYDNKLKMMLWSLIFAIFLFVLPAFFIGFDKLFWQYDNWFVMLQNDHSASLGYSVMGWLQTWFGLTIDKLIILTVGTVVLLLPLIKIKMYKNEVFKLYMFASILIWIILFNHKSESPTFIIAVSGIVLWYFVNESKSKFDVLLIIFAFMFTCLIATDVFPKFVRKEMAEPYVWKVVPCILIWLKVQWDIWNLKLEKKSRI